MNPKALGGVKKLLSKAHWERRRGSARQASDYCQKDDTRLSGPWEVGTITPETPGARNDLVGLKRTIDSGGDPWSEEHFEHMVKYHKGIEAYRLTRMVQRTWITRVEVHVGVPGTGKSEGALKSYPDAYWKAASKWWDGYFTQEVVVLDEFLGWLPFHDLLKLCDGTPMTVEVKGGTRSFVAKRIVLISNKFPHRWYNWQERGLTWEALERRISRDGELYLHQKDKAPEQFKSYDEFLEHPAVRSIPKEDEPYPVLFTE